MERSATWSRRWASEAVVNGTPWAAKRARRGSAGYCSAAGFRQPAEESSAAVPLVLAASANRSHHSRAVGTAAGHLDEVGVGQHVTGTRGRELLDRFGVGVPAGVDGPGGPLGHRRPVVEIVEPPRAEPVDRADEDIERVAGQQLGDLVHPAPVVVDLEAHDDG